MPVHLKALALLLLAACSGGGSDGTATDSGTTTPDYDPAVEVGTGELAFEPLEDGDDIYVVFGPQGGYHVNGSLRAMGIVPGNADVLDDPSNPVTTFRVFRDDVQIDVGITFQQGLEPIEGEPGVFETIGRRVILDITDDAELDGVELVLEVEITDSEGTTVSDRRTVVGTPHPLND